MVVFRLDFRIYRGNSTLQLSRISICSTISLSFLILKHQRCANDELLEYDSNARENGPTCTKLVSILDFTILAPLSNNICRLIPLSSTNCDAS